jgi:serine/threonine protein phosphatase PrpC
LHQLYGQLSEQLLANESIESTYSGSTLVSVLVQNNVLVWANVGDSRAIMGLRTQGGWQT